MQMKFGKTPSRSFSLIALALVGAHSATARAEEMRFKKACSEGTSIVIGGVGDILLHTPLARQGARDPKGFQSLWAGVSSQFKKTDLLYGNFEGTASTADELSSTFPKFNYDPALISDLKKAGFSVVSTANNHALDTHGSGVNSTIRHMDEAGLLFSGTRPTSNLKRPWGVVTEAKGVRIGWVACTFDTNGIEDPKHQVLRCFDQTAQIKAEIARLKKEERADAVIVTPHWGVEYRSEPLDSQVRLGKELLEAGAIAVLGSHPHIMEPIHKFEINGEERVVLYSFGNFVSAQFFGISREHPTHESVVATRTSVVLYLGLTKNPDSGKVVINGMRYMPVYMSSGAGHVNLIPTETNVFENRATSLGVVYKNFPKENQISPKVSKIITNPECAGIASSGHSSDPTIQTLPKPVEIAPPGVESTAVPPPVTPPDDGSDLHALDELLLDHE